MPKPLLITALRKWPVFTQMVFSGENWANMYWCIHLHCSVCYYIQNIKGLYLVLTSKLILASGWMFCHLTALSFRLLLAYLPLSKPNNLMVALSAKERHIALKSYWADQQAAKLSSFKWILQNYWCLQVYWWLRWIFSKYLHTV